MVQACFPSFWGVGVLKQKNPKFKDSLGTFETQPEAEST